MFRYFKRQTVESSDKLVEEGEKKELQKQKESRNLSENNQDFSSGSMVDIDAAMAVTHDPENSGSEQSSEEEFFLAPEFIPRHLAYLEDALMCPDLPTASQIYTSDDNNNDDRGGDNSNESNETHDSSSYYSANQSYDDEGNDIYNNDNVLLQKQEMDIGDFHLHILQSKLEDNYTKVLEGSGKLVEGKEEQKEEHKEYKARRQWKDEEHPLAGTSLVDGVPMSASRDPEIGAINEQSSNEIIVDVEDNLSLIPSPDLVEKVEADPCPRCCSCFCFPCFPL